MFSASIPHIDTWDPLGDGGCIAPNRESSEQEDAKYK